MALRIAFSSSRACDLNLDSQVCHEVSRKLFTCCTKDGGRSSEVCLQESASNQLMLLHPKGVVVSD